MLKRYGTKLDVFVIIAILFCATIITVLNIRTVFQLTVAQTENIGSLQMDNVRAQLQDTLNDAKQRTNQIANDIELMRVKGQGSREDMEAYFKSKKAELSTGSCINVYIAGSDWYIIPDYTNKARFYPINRLWYLGAVEKKGAVFITQPYVDLASNNVCFTVSKVLSDGATVVCLDYDLSDVQKYIEKLSVGGRTALIVTEDGNIAGYSDKSKQGWPLRMALPEYVDVLELEKNNTHQVVIPKLINGVKHTVFCSKTENNWYLLVSVNSDELYKENYQKSIMIGIVNLTLILGIVLLYIITMKNRKKAEDSLKGREEFLKGMASELRVPITAILNNSNPDLVNSMGSQKEVQERIREAALRLSDRVDDLLSYSHIASLEKQNKEKQQGIEFSVANKRIRQAIIAVIMVAMGVSVCLFSTSNMKLGSQQIRKDLDYYEAALSNWTIEQRSILSMFSNMISANPTILEDYPKAVKFLDDITRKYPSISCVYMTNPKAKHTVIMNNGWEPEPTWHVEERKWYIDTMNSATGFNISSPYFDERTGLYCVTFSQRVYDADGNFMGNFGIDFYMDKLIDILGASYKEDGYAFLVDANGKIINHPNAFYQMTKSNSTSVFDPAYRDAYANAGAISYFEDYDGVHKVGLAKLSEDSHFTVMVVKNLWSIYGNIVLYCSLFILMFGICVCAVYYLISRLMTWQNQVNKQLEEAARTATAAGKAKSQFLAQMSHEIRTPINAVLGMNEMIIRETKDKAIREYAEDIKNAGKTLLSLINSILDFSKIEDGKMEIVNVEYDTSSLINDLVNMVAERTAKKNLELKLDIAENLPATMYGDDVRVRQVITNLLTNAVKYTEEGCVTLKMTCERLDDNKLKLLVAVADTGIGIREEDKEMLCQSFKRLDQERNHNIEGTGLGLSIVNKLLNMMDSELKIDSIYGEGSTFYFEIVQGIVNEEPIGDYTKRHYNALEGAAAEQFVYAPRARILVVDDNEVNIKVFCNLIKRNGIIPDTATSGMECLDLAAKNTYDIIFLDFMMPGMDGEETLMQLRNKGLLADGATAVISLTANAISGAREHYLEIGYTDYLSKPIIVERLEQKLLAYLPTEIVEMRSQAELEDATATATEPVAEVQCAKVVEEATDTPEEAEDTTPKLVDLSLGLSYCADDKDIYKEIVEAYLEEAQENIEKLDNFYDKQDWKNYAIVAHAVKSTSLTIGAKTLSELAKLHEFAAKEERADDIDAQYIELLELYQRVLLELKDWLASEEE